MLSVGETVRPEENTMGKRFGFLLLLTVFIVSPTHAQAKIGFGSGFVLLNPKSEGLFFEGKVAPNGQFVVGAGTFDMHIPQESHLFLWDLRSIDRNGVGLEPEPLKSFDMSAYADSSFDKNHIALSPDGRRLAVFSRQDILLLSIPDFELLMKIPVKGLDGDSLWGGIAWSQDGRLLAVNHDNGLTVWDGSQSHFVAYTQGQFFSELVYFADGWLVDGAASFMFCRALLDSCQGYDGVVSTIDEAKRMVITDSPSLPTIAWTQNTQGIFQQDDKSYAYVDGTLSSISPDGKYSFIMRFTKGHNPDYPYYVLYQGKTAMYELHWHYTPIWLGKSGYFVQGNSLYRPDRADPVDSADDLHVGGLTDADWGIWPEYLGGETVSSDGCWYMQLLGKTALVMPVNLPSCR